MVSYGIACHVTLTSDDHTSLTRSKAENILESELTMKVYIWLPRLKLTQVGHSALTLDDGTHISWCPGSKKKIGSKTPREISTLSEDIRLEGREPDFTFSVSELNEAKIKIWWKQLNDSHMKYNVLKRNCCHIIIEALNAGGLKCRMPLLPKPKRVQRLMAAGCGHNVSKLLFIE